MERNCPICSSTRTRPIPVFVTQHLVRCRNCGAVFTDWMPTADELMAYYATYPAVNSVSPVTIKRYQEILDGFAAYRSTGRLLEVGCGGGLFLEQAAHKNWEVHGTEFGKRAVDACRQRGINIVEGPLDTVNYAHGSFDVICSFEVIEHVTDPAAEVRRMASLLRPGGILYLTTPNYNCVARRTSPSTWNVASYPEHLTYFTPRSMHRMLRAAGFRKAKLTTTGFSVQRWKMGRQANAAKKTASREAQEQLRSAMETKPHLRLAKRLVNAVLHLTRSGDSLKATYIRS